MENIFADDILILENALHNQDIKFMEEMTLFTEQYEGREKDDETTKGLSSTLY